MTAPIVVRSDLVSGTLTRGGRWLSLANTTRIGLTAGSARGFGLSWLGGDPDEARLINGVLPHAIHAEGEGRIEVVTFAPRGRPGAVQVVRAFAGEEDLELEVGWDGDMRLDGAADPPGGIDGRVLWLEDRAIGAAAVALPAPTVVPAGMNVPLVAAIALAATLEDAVREAVALAGEGVALLADEVRATSAR